MVDRRDRFVVLLRGGTSLLIDHRTPKGRHELADGRYLDIDSEPRYPRAYSLCEPAGRQLSIDVTGISVPVIEVSSGEVEPGNSGLTSTGSSAAAAPIVIRLGQSWSAPYLLPMPTRFGQHFTVSIYGSLVGLKRRAIGPESAEGALLFRFEVDAATGEISEQSAVALR